VKSIEVNSERRYTVDFVDDWQQSLQTALTERRGIVLTPESMRDVVTKLPKEIGRITLPDGENQKDSGTFIRVMDEIARFGLDRNGVLIGIGGGATTDLTGFVAATYLRGVEWIALPTSLAGMVDASIGGKTGINLAAGKNLAGAFHSPIKVIVDLHFLDTLSDRDLKAGMAEVVKLSDLVHRSIAVKAAVVTRDFKESFEREILNYGHTLGHAIEKHSQYKLRHGECVAIGMVFAAELSRRFSGLDDEGAERHMTILSQLDLPTSYAKNAWSSLYQIMQSDKKKKSNLRFVTLRKIGEPSRLEDTNEGQLREIYEEVVGR
jgi:3-dehydroquinate synthase